MTGLLLLFTIFLQLIFGIMHWNNNSSQVFVKNTNFAKCENE